MSVSIDNEPIPKELAQDILPMFRVKKDTSKKKKTKSLKKVGKKGETEVEKKRREARDLRLRRFTKKENRKRNTYFNQNSAKTIQRVWRGSKTRKSNNLHKKIHQKIDQYNQSTKRRRAEVIAALKEKEQAEKYRIKGYGEGKGLRDPRMIHYNNTTIAYANGLEIDAGREQAILNKKRRAVKNLLKKQKYGQYLKPSARAKRDKELGLGRRGSQNAAQNLENETRSAYYAEHSNPSFVQHSPGIYEEEGETYSTYGWGGRRKTRRKYKRKSRKKRKYKRKSRKKKK